MVHYAAPLIKEDGQTEPRGWQIAMHGWTGGYSKQPFDGPWFINFLLDYNDLSVVQN